MFHVVCLHTSHHAFSPCSRQNICLLNLVIGADMSFLCSKSACGSSAAHKWSHKSYATVDRVIGMSLPRSVYQFGKKQRRSPIIRQLYACQFTMHAFQTWSHWMFGMFGIWPWFHSAHLHWDVPANPTLKSSVRMREQHCLCISAPASARSGDMSH